LRASTGTALGATAAALEAAESRALRLAVQRGGIRQAREVRQRLEFWQLQTQRERRSLKKLRGELIRDER
jgi:hypothetical protein